MTSQGGWPVSSALLVLAITWLATSLDLFRFLYGNAGFIYLEEVVGMPISLVGVLWLGTPAAGFALALLYGRKAAILFGLAVGVVGIRIVSTIAWLFEY
jgi:hypothetical protein